MSTTYSLSLFCFLLVIYRQAYIFRPKTADAYYQVGSLALRERQLDQAEEHLRLAWYEIQRIDFDAPPVVRQRAETLYHRVVWALGVVFLYNRETTRAHMLYEQARYLRDASVAFLGSRVVGSLVAHNLADPNPEADKPDPRVLAKVEQELAIARRIAVAETVEIEEHFAAAGEGSVGVSSSKEKGLEVGVRGSGEKMTKRVYRFPGFHGNAAELIEQIFGSADNGPEAPSVEGVSSEEHMVEEEPEAE